MDCASETGSISEPGVIAAGTEPRSRRAAVYRDRPAPPPPDGRAFLCPDPAFPAARAPRGPFHQQQVRSLRRHALAAALTVFAVLALALPAAAQSVTTLVSNAGQSTTSAPTGGADRAQAFTTGAAGATLSSVEIISGDNEGDDMAVSLCTVDSSGYPTSSCTALTAPSSFASGTLVFTDPASTTLAATTTYTLLITSPGGESLRLANTSSNAEETGAAAGWTIANTYHIKNSANVWEPGGFTTSFLITIKGTLSTTNTAPTAADKTVTTGEDRAYAFTADDFGFDDADDGDTLASVTIVTPPALGTLALDGTAVMADDVVTKAQIDGDMLTFTPARDAHGDPYTTFTFTVNDGTDDSASAYTMTIDVTDAPAPVCGVPGIAGAGRREIWTGTVTVERFEGSGLVFYGFDEGLGGTLLPSQSFFIGSNSYVIDSIAVPPSGNLHFSLEGFSALTSKEVGALRLHVCDGDYDFNTADESVNTTTWLATTLDWSPPVVTRTVYLSLPANNAATGEPTITGTAAVGQPLAVDLTGIADEDGLTNVSYSYQWVRVDADGLSNPADIADATYTLVDADLGKTLKVRVTFDDDGGSTGTLTSAATATVTPAAGAPDSPSNLSATVGVGQVVLRWQHSVGVGGTRSSYEYRSSAGAMISPDAMWQQVSSSPGTLNQAYYQVVKGLTSGTTHTLQVRAENPQGGSAPATVTVTPVSQPSCTIDELGDRRLLWQGQLTAGIRAIPPTGNIETGYGDGGIETGTLTPDAFTFRSTSYSVYPRTYDDFLNIFLREQDIDLWHPREEVVDALRWHVCNMPYDFSSATPADAFSQFAGYQWDVGSNWPPGIERTLRLSLPPNHAATGDPVISGTVQVGEELTALTDGIMDEDVLDDVFTYQWVRVDADGTSNEEDITDALSRTYTLTADERGKKVKVEVRFVDILGGEETRTSAATATLAGTPNTAATGAPTITGTAQLGQTLTASTTGIADANGLTSPTYTYQWIRVNGTEADIAGENSSTYTLVDADLGTTLKVRVSFTDDASNSETLTSAATATVGAVATAPTVSTVAVTSTPASGTTYYLAGEAIEFTVTFGAPVTVTATPKFAFRLGAATRQAAYASGSDSAALVFARTVQAGEVDRNGISWNALALALDGGTITRTGATTAAILTHAEQASLEGHRVDAAPPMQVSASVQGMSLVLVYDETLDPASMPATGAYTVTATVGATTTNPEVSEVSIYGIWLTLTLDAAPAAGATVTLAYAPPASNPVQDEAGNDAPAFSGQKVNGAAGNTAPTGAPTITGTAQVGQTLTAVTTGIVDANELTSPGYTYQWIRVNGTEADIAGENSSTYTLVDADRRRTNEKDDFRVPGRHHADGGIRPGAGRRLVGHFHTRRYQWIRVRLPKWRR